MTHRIILLLTCFARGDAFATTNAVRQRAAELLQLGKGASTASPWRVEAMLADTPPGAYFELMDPILAANQVAYCASAGQVFSPDCVTAGIPADYAGGGSWERIFGLETASSTTGGPHVVVFVDRDRARSLVAIRGSCLDGVNFEQCNMDMCFLRNEVNGFGNLSDVAYGGAANFTKCGEYSGKLDYFEQSVAIVRKVRDAFPDYDTLITGHSMGAMLANLVAGSEPGLKAVTFAPTPYYDFATTKLGWTDETFNNMNARDIKSTCDAFDCGINSVFEQNARLGSETCLFSGIDEPEPCQPYANDTPYLTGHWRHTYARMGVLSLPCKGSAHDFNRYYQRCHERESEGSSRPNTTLTCSQKFSVLHRAASQTRGANV